MASCASVLCKNPNWTSETKHYLHVVTVIYRLSMKLSQRCTDCENCLKTFEFLEKIPSFGNNILPCFSSSSLWMNKYKIRSYKFVNLDPGCEEDWWELSISCFHVQTVISASRTSHTETERLKLHRNLPPVFLIPHERTRVQDFFVPVASSAPLKFSSRTLQEAKASNRVYSMLSEHPPGQSQSSLSEGFFSCGLMSKLALYESYNKLLFLSELHESVFEENSSKSLQPCTGCPKVCGQSHHHLWLFVLWVCGPMPGLCVVFCPLQKPKVFIRQFKKIRIKAELLFPLLKINLIQFTLTVFYPWTSTPVPLRWGPVHFKRFLCSLSQYLHSEWTSGLVINHEQHVWTLHSSWYL